MQDISLLGKHGGKTTPGIIGVRVMLPVCGTEAEDHNCTKFNSTGGVCLYELDAPRVPEEGVTINTYIDISLLL